MFELNNFSSIQIGVASPEKIRSWSHGEVTKGETINYRTQKPEKDGLFCEVIFGPVRSNECACGKCKQQNIGTVCDRCGVLVTDSKVRRERMGHIELAAPVSHIWYYKGSPSAIATCLNIGAKELESILYLDNKYIVIDPGTTDFVFKETIDINQKREAEMKFGFKSFVAKSGAEAIKELLSMIDLEAESKALRAEVANSEGARKLKASKRLDIIESFRLSGNRPEWMILDVIPVLPPDIRPMVPLDGGRFAASDLNELYRRVIQRNNRLKRLMEMGAPDVMLNNEKRLLQEAVDSLFDNGRHGKPVQGPGGRPYKSLTNMLKGKQGRFRQNLLGKRVDYSGRSVIVVGPELKMHQCGLPKEMALELFKPFIIRKLVEYNYCANHNIAKKFLKNGSDVVWNILEEVIKDHPVMLNRAPTLHRLGIQAFEPVLVEGRAIKLHPLACTAFNADFDGDQMAVHVPLSLEAQAEARFLMLSTNNILKLSDGEPVVSPSQDMVIGSYYLTIERNALVKDENGEITPISSEEYYERRKKGETLRLRSFKSFDEAFMAYQLKELGLQDIVTIRNTQDIEVNVYGTKMVKSYSMNINTTVGRCIFNKSIPQDIGYVNKTMPQDDSLANFTIKTDKKVEYTNKRYNPDKEICTDKDSPDFNIPQMNLVLEVEDVIGKNQLSAIVDKCFARHGSSVTTDMLDKIKSTGYKYSTIGAVTTCVFDMTIPPQKKEIVDQADKEVEELERLYSEEGILDAEEKSESVKKVWRKATEDLKNIIKAGSLGKFNPIHMMCNSGARGNIGQINQLCGMRGLLRDTTGKELERPVKANFREGLSVLEYFISTHGGRKGLTDTALKTADSGYLTRKLVDVSQDCIVNEEDCGDTKGFVVSAIKSNDSGDILEPLKDRIRGRYCMDDVVDPTTGEVLAPKDTLISKELAAKIDKAGVENVRIRSVLSCKSKHGVCAKCYGANMASGEKVKVGEAVGVIAAQSIGEPGTQLTMRTFHTGGVASTADITQGLPRVTELFEARKPANGEAMITKVDGVVSYNKKDRIFTITRPNGEEVEYKHNYGLKPLVDTGDHVVAGDALTAGSIFPKDLLATRGVKGVQDYLIKEVQSAYRSNGVEINDKHTEVIVRQMLKKVEVTSQGDTDMLVGEKYDIFTFEENNEKILSEGGMPATAKRVLLGITQASVEAESFLSAASFQNTATVLTKAAIKNKKDELRGLKENVILGKLIPAGTGMKCYQGVDAVSVESQELNINETDEHIDNSFEDYTDSEEFGSILDFGDDE